MTQVNKELTPEELEKLRQIEALLSDKDDLDDEEVEHLQAFFKKK